ncbi:hypothetical protein [uncultured Phocaeicola sp.]|uniref:hypothetical protein n=1 Tax=uncultured Phocaeicola sp. TaxID=990718 RepID=UPI0025E9482A|nr:hypothetical protein [uncultured Phocaeicola sp.]
MSKKPQTSFETNKPFTLRVLYSGHGVYETIFSYQEISLFLPLSDQQYREYRKLCYLRPVGAKNYLLDLICFERTPYQRSDFEFFGKDEAPTKEMIALWQEIERNL